MSKLNFFNDDSKNCLYPIGAMQGNESLQLGAFSIKELWEGLIQDVIANTEQKNAEKVQFAIGHGELNDRWIPSKEALFTLSALPIGTDLYGNEAPLFRWTNEDSTPSKSKQMLENADILNAPHELFTRAGDWIHQQANRCKQNWGGEHGGQIKLPSHVHVIGPLENLIMAPGARVLGCTINTEEGPVLLGPGSEVQEGSHVRGPLYLGAGSVLKMGAKIYGPTSIGEQCRIGGEVSNSVFLGFSNKGHDGFVGNSVIGRWCNLGAATNTSNLKSNYSKVKMWNVDSESLEATGLQFCGLIMGDHSKSGINTMFNAGSVVGAGCNIFGSGFQPKHIPPFSWGGGKNWTVYDLGKFLQTARSVMERRGCELTPDQIHNWTNLHQNLRSSN